MIFKKPLVINFFGGPGCGKSTTAALLFGSLKQKGYNVELVTEYAKELVWEERNQTLGNQIYLLGKQTNRIEILKDKVDAVITDSPLLLCSIYRGEHYPESFDELVRWQFDQHDNVNFFLNRQKKFNPKGRVHSLKESVEIDTTIKTMLDDYEITYEEIEGNEDGVEEIKKKVSNIMLTRSVLR
jgi:ABC-type oligopeptide transport system ATPase subunit